MAESIVTGLRYPRSAVTDIAECQGLRFFSSSPIMGLFNRKANKGLDSSESDNKKEKGGWKRPASMSMLIVSLLSYLTIKHRYRLQAAAA